MLDRLHTTPHVPPHPHLYDVIATRYRALRSRDGAACVPRFEPRGLRPAARATVSSSASSRLPACALLGPGDFPACPRCGSVIVEDAYRWAECKPGHGAVFVHLFALSLHRQRISCTNTRAHTPITLPLTMSYAAAAEKNSAGGGAKPSSEWLEGSQGAPTDGHGTANEVRSSLDVDSGKVRRGAGGGDRISIG